MAYSKFGNRILVVHRGEGVRDGPDRADLDLARSGRKDRPLSFGTLEGVFRAKPSGIRDMRDFKHLRSRIPPWFGGIGDWDLLEFPLGFQWLAKGKDTAFFLEPAEMMYCSGDMFNRWGLLVIGDRQKAFEDLATKVRLFFHEEEGRCDRAGRVPLHAYPSLHYLVGKDVHIGLPEVGDKDFQFPCVVMCFDTWTLAVHFPGVERMRAVGIVQQPMPEWRNIVAPSNVRGNWIYQRMPANPRDAMFDAARVFEQLMETAAAKT